MQIRNRKKRLRPPKKCDSRIQQNSQSGCRQIQACPEHLEIKKSKSCKKPKKTNSSLGRPTTVSKLMLMLACCAVLPGTLACKPNSWSDFSDAPSSTFTGPTRAPCASRSRPRLLRCCDVETTFMELGSSPLGIDAAGIPAVPVLVRDEVTIIKQTSLMLGLIQWIELFGSRIVRGSYLTPGMACGSFWENEENPVGHLLWLGFLGFIGMCWDYGVLRSRRRQSIASPKHKRRYVPKGRQPRLRLSIPPRAFAARLCGHRRVQRPRLRCRRFALKMRIKRITPYRKKPLRTVIRSQRRGLIPPLCPFQHDNSESLPTWYDEWLGKVGLGLQGGAGGSARTRRKRKEKSNKSDVGLSTMIRTLKTFLQHGDPAQIQTLTSVLQGALEQPVLERIPQTPNHWTKQPQGAASVLFQGQSRRVTKDPDERIEIWKGSRYRLEPSGWWTWLGYVKEPPHVWPQQTPHKAETADDRLNHKITAIRPQDWKKSPVPMLTHPQALRQALRDGARPPGNLCEIWDQESLDSLTQLWDAFGDPGPLTLLVHPGVSLDQKVVTSLSLTRGWWGSKLEKIGLFQVSSKHTSPWIFEATKVDPKDLPKTDKVTARIVAPAMYRNAFLESTMTKDTPSAVIGALSQSSNIPVAQLLGGRWIERHEGANHCLMGFLHVRPETYEKLAVSSGSKAVFVSKCGNRSGEVPFWLPKTLEESKEAYFRRALQTQSTRVQPMFYRNGSGGSNLGFPSRTEDKVQDRVKQVVISGVPPRWDSQDLSIFFGNQKWSQFEIVSARRHLWIAKALPPQDLRERSAWYFRIEEDKPWTITVQVQVRSPNQSFTVPIKAPRRDAPVVASTPKLDSNSSNQDSPVEIRGRTPHKQDQRTSNETTDEPRPRSRSREKSDPPKSSSKELNDDPPKIIDVGLGPDQAKQNKWCEVDLGGVGDCFFPGCGLWVGFGKRWNHPFCWSCHQ